MVYVIYTGIDLNPNPLRDGIIPMDIRDIRECQRLIEDTYGDAVYLAEDEYAVTMDEFIRMAQPDEKFYIGNVLLMH